MSLKLFIIAVLCASAFADGAWVNAFYRNGTGNVDFFTRLRFKYPDFVIIDYEDQYSFNQSYQNAVTAGYTSIHLGVYMGDPLEPENIPANFNGRIWIEGMFYSFSTEEIVKKIQDLANQGYKVGILTPDYKPLEPVPSIISSLPLAWDSQRHSWSPMGGWNCPSQTLVSVGLDPADMNVWSSTVNVGCI